MANKPGMSVGGVPLNPKRVNKPFLREMYKAAQKAETTEGKQEALDAITELGKTGEMDKDSLQDLDTFRKSVDKEWRADKDAMWSTYRSNGKNWKDPKIKKIKEESDSHHYNPFWA